MSIKEVPIVTIEYNGILRDGFICSCGWANEYTHHDERYPACCWNCGKEYVTIRRKGVPVVLKWSALWKCDSASHRVDSPTLRCLDGKFRCSDHARDYIKKLQDEKESYETKLKEVNDMLEKAIPYAV